MAALNTPLNAVLSDVTVLLQSIRLHVEHRRAAAEVTAHYDTCAGEHLFGISINGKKAWRKVDSRESVWRAINEMIDELWPLELIP